MSYNTFLCGTHFWFLVDFIRRSAIEVKVKFTKNSFLPIADSPKQDVERGSIVPDVDKKEPRSDEAATDLTIVLFTFF